MTSVNNLKFLMIFGLVISLVFSFTLIGEEYYYTPYNGEGIVGDGVLYGEEWEEYDTVTLIKDDFEMAEAKMIQNGEELCIGFVVLGTNDSITSIKMAFDLNEDGIYDEDDDFGRVFYSPGHSVGLGSTVNYLSDGSGSCYGITPYDPWDNKCGLGISGSSYDYSREQFSAWIFVYWHGELCIEYDRLDMTLGEEKTLRAIFAVQYESDDGLHGWYTWPENADHPDTEEWGYIFSLNNWAHPDWCYENSDCADNEYCMQALAVADNRCELIEEGTCGHIEDHAWHDYECCADEDCDDGETCNLDGHVCEEIPPDCTVGGDIECCSNSDCADNEYCSDNSCLDVDTDDCGYVEDHAWHDYECCADEDCDDGEECSSHSCVDEGAEATCGGLIDLQFAYNTNTEKVKALVGGIDHCTGKAVMIKEESCSGDTVCSFVSGDEGGNCEFDQPSEAGFYFYSACIDLDGDGVMEFDQEGYQVEEDDDDGCESDGCTPTEWSDCICSEGSTLGTTSGTCTDNCGTLETVVTSCNCEDDGPSEEQLDAEEAIADAEGAIEEAEEEGKNVEEAEVKLEQAQEAYDSENYELAKELALEAYALVSEDEGTGESKEWWEDSNNLMIGGMVLLGLAVIYLIADKIFGSKGGKKSGRHKPLRLNKKDEPLAP